MASSSIKKVLSKVGSANEGSWEDAMAKDAEHVQDLQGQMKTIKEEVDMVKGRMMDRMDERNRKSLKVKFSDGKVHNIAKVQATSVHILWDKLKKRVGAGMWKKITIQVPDQKLLEAHMANGEIDPTVVAECSEETAAKPYIKVT